MKEMIMDLVEDWNEFCDNHPFIAGLIEGQVVVYWVMVIAAIVTGKKWDLVEMD